ncbi:hypothetical protein RVR_5785 [Actinacidiphila reveromycinica]|uniref:Uncharacterized protein n=1 Tax=Actinacidiphila reveromycinica TaxID=659352 RepID=A0A7U3UV95_9ACTN|nr:hypothetical protein [Streptomyces sp. SN-593]BBA99246.1 hypothetical protein RVR_5785 [Streptomyces sp. SN-593]
MSFSPTINQPAIETATVEIRVLTVNGRSMNTGRFRQLIDAPLISPAGEFEGEPWGAVNLHPDKCEGDDHVHVVWQDGDQLRRARINAPEHALFEAPVAAHYAMARILDGERDLGAARNPSDYFRCYSGRDRNGRTAYVRLRHDEVLFLSAIPVAFDSLWQYGSGDMGALRLAADEVYGGPLPSVEDLADQLSWAADAYRAAWSALEGLPQLFVGG